MKILPPVLVLIFVAVMAVLRTVLPGPVIIPDPWNWLGLVLIAGGLAVTVMNALRFARVGTNIKTFDDPTLLVTDGAFQWSRNPMYLGFSAGLVGLAVLLGTLFPFFVAVAFPLIADRWYIPFEERALRRTFGEGYEAYARAVRRWL